LLQLQAALAIHGFAVCSFGYPRIIFNAQNLVSQELSLIISGFLPILSLKMRLIALTVLLVIRGFGIRKTF